LIEQNKARFETDRIKFACLNIIDDALPDGDVCFLRQVLQHLSNNQIQKILSKLQQYQWVFLTEHYPSDNDKIKPNIDKVHGTDIRLCNNSGVYFTEPPFSLPSSKLSLVLQVDGHGFGKDIDPGVIRTYLYKP